LSFINSAQYYNLLYKDKEYQKEVNYIIELINVHSKIKVETILDLGCGTGNHDELFANNGFKVTGIDISETMIAIAKKKEKANLNFLVNNANSFDLNVKYDIILSLFDAMCYQTSNTDLKNTFTNISSHLNKDGLLIFDFWYGPAVLSDKPVKRIKEFEDDEIRIIRTAKPKMLPNDNIGEVNYELIIENKKTKKQKKINELHRVRYFFKKELELLLELNDLKLIHEEEFITKKKLGSNTWKACWVIKKK
jgi:SAM-dependent methyltransferase